jgi:EAL domain-containing protein (putative c-di-GMP-specific phosphodiesterase class I)/ActR/RegA family two-component response regulator
MTSTLTAQAASRGLPRILLVDDEPAVLTGLRRQLRSQYQVVTATDGATALQLLQYDGPFAVVVSDMCMRIMDGATFLAGARAAARDTVRILLTGQADIHAPVSAVNRGQVFRCLSTPCPSESLQDCLCEVLEQHRLSEARTEILEQAAHTTSLPSFISESDQATAALEQAFATGQFLVRYQPVVDLHTQEVVGAEGLIRWKYPQQGPVAPAEFIPFAEQRGLVLPIGRWVLLQSCRDAATRPGSSGTPLFMAVSVSSREVRDLHVDDVRDALRESGMLASFVKLEITESTLLEDPHQAGQTLQSLRELGIGISMDDFGTGYSSLSSIQNLPIDEFKIDCSFVESLPGATSEAVAETIVRLGRTLGLALSPKASKRPSSGTPSGISAATSAKGSSSADLWTMRASDKSWARIQRRNARPGNERRRRPARWRDNEQHGWDLTISTQTQRTVPGDGEANRLVLVPGNRHGGCGTLCLPISQLSRSHGVPSFPRLPVGCARPRLSPAGPTMRLAAGSRGSRTRQRIPPMRGPAIGWSDGKRVLPPTALSP